MKTQIITDLWGLQPEVANQQQLNCRNEHNVLCVNFFVTGMNNSVGSGMIIEPGRIDGGGVSNVS
jgi:hypothetical protein